MNEEIGAKLKTRRQELGLSIEEVVEKTKLYPSVIRDLEEGNFSNINHAYLKGFIKIYASFLGLNYSELSKVAGGEQIKPKDDKKNAPAFVVDKAPKIKFTIKAIPLRVRQVITAVLLALVALFVFIKVGSFVIGKISQFAKRPVTKTKVTARAARKPSAAKEKDIFKEKLPKQGVKPKASPVKESSPKSAPVKDITVFLTAKKNCFLTVKVDGKILLEGMLDKGKMETWKGQKEIELKISDGSAVYLEVNGKPVPPLTSSKKKIKSLKINSSGIAVVK
ncbi:MAG: DUF4115 domain-containing protein [Candidatus Omnitrophica bacterium]|nr:DUF4115 domain-containing protein [Candidatus Omnitrophota bacterium]